MVDLHDEGPGAQAPGSRSTPRRSASRSTTRRARVAAATDEDLSGGIPRPARPTVGVVDAERFASDAEPAVPPWVNDGTARVSEPPAVARTAEEPDDSDVSDREAVPLVIVPAVQPDDSSTAAKSSDGVMTSTTATDSARRQLQVPRRARVRRVTRVIRYVDPWGVFKVALVFNLVGYATTLVAGVLLWNVAHATGTVDNVERFMESFGWESFEFRGGEIFHHAWIVGLFVVVGLTGLAVLIAATFNLVTDLVGGMRVTVLEEELVAMPARPWLRTTPSESLAPASPSADHQTAVTGADADP